ncbi:MAG: 30S ribosomal protein S1 [Ignavibacteriota bacterium]|jgi:small subunit ribosomal protein S1|nr:MAG: 30S ribosomal protein S1 [Ignavibacterium sp.]MBL1155406.1 30S ribosomal protein S1 [Ignavibacteriota bacterium]MCO6446173.1 30S ribosomal protein S1 [Ignavibacterium album]MCZ2268374.1 30S ribosomal protein S1 [Ignavibacteriales bacterium]MDX9713046.1 30S ribosomal protein S1 [Ignavibacteriaceae bacterium]
MSETKETTLKTVTPDEYEKAKVKFNDDEYSQEEFLALAKLYSDSFRDVKEGELIKGKVVRIQGDNVIVDVGFKSEGTIPKIEFANVNEIKIGQEIEVVLESVEDQEGNLVLSKQRADFLRIWEKVLRAHDTGEIIEGKIVKRIKGGMVVDLLGMEAFLPGSQIDIRPIRDFDAFVGQTMDFKVVKVNVPTENVVVSHKVLVEEEISDQRNAVLNSLEKGQILEGVVKAITDFGVFVDLGGVDGLIHITDLSWGRINHPNEVVKLDEVIKVVVTEFDEEKKRISLSLKKLLPHPWEKIEEKYNLGDKVSGRVVSLTDYGAFIEIEKGIEGLIHNSEMSWTQHIKHPSQIVAMGQLVEAIILSLDKEEKKISLGIKQLEPDPWDTLMAKYPVGSKHSGIARNLTNFGVFVELEPGVDGLVHISDLSWTKKIRHPGEVVKKNERIDVIVLGVDVEQRKISLGHKQIMDNPWDLFEKEYSVGKITDGKVVRIIEKGIIAELPSNVDGFVPTTQLSTSKIKNIANHFPIDSTLPLKVIEFDKESKKIVLSAIAALKEKDDAEIEKYLTTFKLDKVSVQSIKNAEMGTIDSSEFPIFEVAEPEMPKKEETE